MFDGLARHLDAPHRVRVIGAPFDGAASFRPGQRFGPTAMREASNEIETYSPVLDRDLEDCAFADAGDLALPIGDVPKAFVCIEQAVSQALADGVTPCLLGGDHAASIPAIRAASAYFEDLRLIQLDAHADLRAEWQGTHLSHACVIARAAECIPPERIRQIGIRSGTREEYRWMREHGTLITFRDQDLAALRDWAGDAPVYLTVDLDVFDPAFLPGTGTPEPGGIDWWTYQRFVQAMQGLRLIGFDVMELAPGLDASGCSSILAAKALRELLLIAA